MSSAHTQVGIVEWAQRTRDARAIEVQLAARLGRWVPLVPSAAAKLLLARHARHCAAHVEMWDSLVPVLHDQPVSPAISEPRLVEAADLLARTEEPVELYDRVLPPIVAAFRAWSAETTPIAERPAMRVLDLVLRDLDFDAQEGHDLLS